ncbi:CAP domain-containing protein [Phenylobacterium sp. VNQ135]|uniref:CAP domain-containing protein n=1 Tax=Phenylobacterium sp. VNQ135 TaxID=3400922 RepID=UPI003C08873D
MPAPTALEQYMLELVNQYRISQGVQPLAWDPDLGESAELHSQWVLQTDTFTHEGAGGSSPTARMAAAGYQLTGSWTTAENLALRSINGTPTLQDDVELLHQQLLASPGHHANIVNATLRELGVGIELGEYQGYQAVMATQNFAKTGTAFFITGVAFDDLDGDLRYDVGEGLGGLTVTVATAGGAVVGATSTYAQAGGYELAVSPGTYNVTFSGGGFASVTRTVTVGSANVKVDWADPQAAGGGATPGNDNLAGTPLYGGAGNDTLTGTVGQDFLRGEDGNDSLYGGAAFDDLHGNLGEDTVVGGPDGDWVVGGQGQDVLFGEDGDDVVLGNLGQDTADGGAGDDVVRGGQGHDLITGGFGADYMAGDRGEDTIAGGAGADTFHSFGEAGLDRILDFNRAEGDRVNLVAGSTYSFGQVGNDVVINVTGGARIELVGVSMASLTGDWLTVG